MHEKLIKALLMGIVAVQFCLSPMTAIAATAISGDTSGKIKENNSTQSIKGKLDAKDNADGSAVDFVVQNSVDGDNTLGRFSIDKTGNWTYTMNSPHNEFKDGEDHADSIVVSTVNGFSIPIKVTITGTNDPAIISPLKEFHDQSDTPLTANGILTIEDVDSPKTFVAKNENKGSYGKFSLTTNGAWDYKADRSYAGLLTGQSYADTFEIKSTDETTEKFTIVINGTKEKKKKIWNSSLYLGVQFLPDYDESGNNNGLDKTREYAVLNLDSRWKIKRNGEEKGRVGYIYNTLNTGLEVKMLGTAVARDDEGTSSTSTKFNDVSNTIDSSLYLQLAPFEIAAGSEIGVIFRGGIITRDKKAANDGILDDYHKIGLRYTYIEGVPDDHKGVYENTFTGYFDISYARFSDYADGEIDRLVIDSQYRLIADTNWFIGFNANIGPGQDEFYLTTSIMASIKQIKDAFGFGSSNE